MKRKITSHKQTLEALVFVDEIKRTSKQNSFMLKVTNDKGIPLSLKTDYVFRINQKNNEFEFQKKKHSDNFGEITYSFSLYTKSSLFAISDKSLQATLKTIFEKEKCENILGSELITSSNESSFYYTTDVNFEKIKKEYEYNNVFVKNNIETEAKTVTSDEIENVISILQKEVFYAIVLKNIEQKALQYFSDYKDKKEYISKSLNALFGKSLLDDDDMSAEKILDITMGAEYLIDIIKDDFPLNKIRELYIEDKFLAGKTFGENIRQIVNGNILFADFNVSNENIIAKTLEKNFPYCKSLSVPVFSDIDKDIQESLSFKKDTLYAVKEHGEHFYNASLSKAMETYQRSGSPAYYQQNAMFAFQKITKKEDILNNLVLQFNDNTNVFLIKGESEQETNALAEKFMYEIIDSEKMTLPVRMDDGSILLTLKSTSNLYSGSMLKDSEEMSPSEFRSFINIGVTKDNFYSVFSSNKKTIDYKTKENILDGLKIIASHVVASTNSKHISTYMNFLNKKISESSKDAPREAEVLAASKKLKNNDMSFLSGFVNIHKKDKIFPDIINIDSSSKMSLEDISTSLFHISRWLMIPEYSQTIKEQLEKNGFVVPDIHPYKFNLTDPSKNILPDEKKQSIVSTKSHAGILNFQILPTIIEIETEKDIDKFLDFSAQAIAFPYIKLSGEEVFSTKAQEIYQTLFLKYKTKLIDCKYIFTKITSVFEDGLVKKEEKFVALDENLNEKIVFNTPVFDFYSILQKQGMLKLENRMKNSSFKSSDIDEIFNVIEQYVVSIENKNEKLFKKIDEIFLPAIEKAIGQSDKFNFSITNKIALISAIQKKNGKFFSEEMMNTKERTFQEKVDMIFIESPDEKSQLLKKSLLEFYELNLQGKEYYLLDSTKEIKIRKIFIDRFGEYDYRVKDFYNLIIEESSKINKKLENDVKIITLRAFSKHIQKKTQGTLDTEGKNEIINEFLYKVLGLQPHQSLEVKGFLALHMRDEINVELLFWEMRTKKTRTMIAMLLLASLIKKSPSVFFLQNKNYDDIVGQAFDMLPFIVSDTSALLGANVSYKAEEAKLPAALTDFIFPNIVSILKHKKILKNPQYSRLAPADILAENYTNVFYKIFNISKEDPAQKLKDALEEHKEDYPEFNYYEKLVDKSASPILKAIIVSTYFYVLKLFHEGFLKQSDAKIAADAIKNKMNSFIKEYAMSNKISSISEESPAKIIFAGKQFIDTFVASEDKENKLKSENKNKNILHTSLDVEVSIEESERIENDIPLDELRDALSSSIVLDSDLQKIVDRKMAVTFVNSFSAFQKEYADDIVQHINNVLTRAFDTYADTIYDPDVRASFFSSYKILKKVITLPIVAVLKDVNANHEFVEDEIYEIETIKYNEKAIKPTCIKIDNLFAEKIQKSLPNVLTSAGVFDSENEAKELISDLIYSQSIPEKISEAVTIGGLKHLMSLIYFRKDGKTNSINKAMTTLLPFPSTMKFNTIDVKFTLEPKYYALLGIAKYTKTDLSSSYEQFPIVLQTEIIDSENPSYFKNSTALPTEIVISQENGKFPTLHINSAVDLNANNNIGTMKKDTKKLSSSYLWELQDKRIGAISIDEAHKNITGNKKITTAAILRKIKSSYQDAIQIVSTGTPNKHGEFIEVVSGNIGEKTKRTIDKYCGIYQIDSLMITAILEKIKTDKTLVNNIDKLIIESVENVKSHNKELLAGQYSYRLEQIIENSKNVMTYYTALKEVKNSRENGFSISSIFETIMTKILNRKDTKEGLDIGDGIKLFENVILEPKNKIAKKVAGVTNPIGMSEIFRFFINSNLSIKRPAGGVSYDIIDKDKVEIFGKRSLHKDLKAIDDKEKVLELQYLLYKKAFNGLAGNEIYRFYEILFSIAEQGLQENSEALLGMELSEFNEVSNRSEKTVEDSLKDIFMARIIKGERNSLTPEKEKIFVLILDIMKHFQEHKIPKIINTKKDDQVAINMDNGFSVIVDAKVVEEMKNVVSALKDKNVYYLKSLVSDEIASFFSLTSHGVKVQDSKSSILLRGEINISFEINKKLPPLEMLISLSSADDISIIEALAYNKQAIALSLKHLDNGDNTRHMTTRIALTKAAILFALSSGEQRTDKRTALNLVISISDKGISSFVDDIMKSSKQFLKDNNINIIKTNSKRFNIDCVSPLNKKEQITVIGNYSSLAEGIAMDFIQTGFYHGALDNISASIQSFARQTGHLQQESRFYLANDGQLSSIKGNIRNKLNIKNVCDFYAPIEINDKNSEKYKKAFFVFDKLKRVAPYTGNRNNSIMEHFKAYELVMTGDFAYLRDNVNEKELIKRIEHAQEAFLIPEQGIDENITKSEDEEESISPSV